MSTELCEDKGWSVRRPFGLRAAVFAVIFVLSSNSSLATPSYELVSGSPRVVFNLSIVHGSVLDSTSFQFEIGSGSALSEIRSSGGSEIWSLREFTLSFASSHFETTLDGLSITISR